LDYDDVVNKQRELIYTRRREALERDEVKSEILDLLHEEIEEIVGAHAIGEKYNWEVKNII
jgi:preprotein translocase subunit SecA